MSRSSLLLVLLSTAAATSAACSGGTNPVTSGTPGSGGSAVPGGSGGSSGSGGVGQGTGGVPDEADGAADGVFNPEAPEIDAGTSLVGTEACVDSAGNVQKIPVSISASQIVQTSTTFTILGLNVGPVGGWSCLNQTFMFFVESTSPITGIEFGSGPPDAGASTEPNDTCAITTGGPLAYVGSGSYLSLSGGSENLKSLMLEVDFTNVGADGGLSKIGVCTFDVLNKS